jgi:hypothetical protein
VPCVQTWDDSRKIVAHVGQDALLKWL